MTLLQVYVLADTSYNSEGVDEVAAQHVQGDCVVPIPASFVQSAYRHFNRLASIAAAQCIMHVA